MILFVDKIFSTCTYLATQSRIGAVQTDDYGKRSFEMDLDKKVSSSILKHRFPVLNKEYLLSCTFYGVHPDSCNHLNHSIPTLLLEYLLPCTFLLFPLFRPILHLMQLII